MKQHSSGSREYQARYFVRSSEANARIQPTVSPYVRMHVERAFAGRGLEPGQRVLEVGAGMGRFTRLLVERGLDVVASDLAEHLLERVQQELPGVTTLACDVDELADKIDRRFDAVVGFFMLHHLPDLRRTFATLAEIVSPGGQVMFCEPNAYNPLYYLQIALTRMTWKGDGGVVNMRPSVVNRAMEAAGFEGVTCERYGLFPPFLYNTRVGQAVERMANRVPLPPPMRAFQVFSGRMPG